MKYLLNYGNRVVSIPHGAIDVMPRASANDVKVLLLACAQDGKLDEKKAAKQLSISEDDVKAAIAFWRGAGIVSVSDNANVEDNGKQEEIVAHEENISVAEPKKLHASEELPRYSTDELANVLESRAEVVALIDECQRIAGKVYNVKEINVLVGLVDYLGLEPEYVMMLLTYCVGMGKKSLHYVEKTAFGLYDAGITTGDQLAEELRRREAAGEAEGKIRSLFGVGDRAFTTK